jgi:hypothetical protein
VVITVWSTYSLLGPAETHTHLPVAGGRQYFMLVSPGGPGPAGEGLGGGGEEEENKDLFVFNDTIH